MLFLKLFSFVQNMCEFYSVILVFAKQRASIFSLVKIGEESIGIAARSVNLGEINIVCRRKKRFVDGFAADYENLVPFGFF